MRYDFPGARVRHLDVVRAIRPVIHDDANCPSRRTQRRKPVGDDLDLIGQMHTLRHLPRLAKARHCVARYTPTLLGNVLGIGTE
jgi:hypothetical protein